ncbi:MAG: phosphoglycerate dehydrogenase [Desulfovibrio sp.]|nr:phosphoglycerate dehydrogenase [Desulfovibrio sp.]
MKVLVTPRSFGKTDPGLFDRLKDAGLEVIRNETGGILDEGAMKELIAPCEGVILGVDPMNAAVLDAAPRLRAIAKYGVGLDNIDLAACEARGIKVSRTVGANSDAVADYAFALMLGVARRVAFIDRRCRERDWSKITSIDVYSKTLGIIGLGAIGRRVARRAKGFDMRVLASDSVWDESFAVEHGIERADADRICRECDFITLHCLLNDETRNIINERRIASMKPTAVLVNTARGGLIDEAALLAALKAGSIWGAGLDVFAHEPPEEPDWYILNNVIMGSHCSSSTAGAVNLMGTMAVDNLLRDLGLPL